MSVYNIISFAAEHVGKSSSPTMKPTEYIEVSKLTAEQCKAAGVDSIADSDSIIPVSLVQPSQKFGGPVVGR